MVEQVDVIVINHHGPPDGEKVDMIDMIVITMDHQMVRRKR